jgi:DNA primase
VFGERNGPIAVIQSGIERRFLLDSKMIVEILEDIDADQIQEHSKNVQCCCFMSPYRNAHRYGQDRRPSMGVSINDAGFSLVHCFACQYSATLVNALGELEEKSGEDLTEVIKKARSFERLDPEAIVHSVRKAEKKERKEVVVDEALLDEYEVTRKDGSVQKVKLVPGAHQSIIDRGLSIETLKAWGARWDATFKRVMFPVRNFNGQLVGGVGRAVSQSKIKYFNYFRFDKSLYLFGEHLTSRDRPVVLVEGQIDAILLWQYFKENEVDADVVALAGSIPSKHQLQKVVRNWDTVVLFLDNDFVGWDGTKTIARAIQRKVLLKVMTYSTEGGDPAELVQQGIDVKTMYERASLAMVTRSSR